MTDWLEHIRDGISAFIAAIIAAIVAGVGWLVRTVFTSQKKIELLEQELRHRDARYADMSQVITDVKHSVDRIEGVLMERK